MDEINKLNNFQSVLKISNEKKQLSVYCAEEKQSILCSKALKPQDVIATVSKQLRDIQKADSIKKGCDKRIAKSRQSDFVPINILYSQDGFQPHNIIKFETQCVTDTQLIDIVDNIEAMIDVNISMSQDPQTTSCQKECNSKMIEGEIVTLCGENDNVIIENNFSQDLQNIKLIRKQKQNELCINEINTGIYKEFNMPYSGTQEESTSIKSGNKVISKQHCRKDDNVTKKGCSHLKNNIQDRFCIDLNMENDGGPFEEKEFLSPVFKSCKSTEKTKTPSPLIFSLDSFEKFESLAMPILERNIDLETAKYIINSQIIDNQLLISANTKPILNKSTDSLICEINKCNTKVSGNILDKDDQIETLLDSKLIVNKSTSFDDEILFSSDEENDLFHYYPEVLPLTCALKTSCYETEVDLNETVFVGFQTGSDKCIQVRKDSYVKAKNIFDSIDEKENANLTLTELIDIYDCNAFRCNNNFPTKKIFHKYSETVHENVNNLTHNFLKSTTIENDNVKVLEEEFIGFKTANGKSINISEKALLKCNSVFKDIEKDIGGIIDASNMISKKSELMVPKTANNKSIDFSEESLPKTSSNFDHIDLNLCKIPFNIDEVLKKNGKEKIQVIENQALSECASFIVKDKSVVNGDCMNLEDQSLLQEFENESIEEARHEFNQRGYNDSQRDVDLKKTEIKWNASLKNNENSGNNNDRVSNFDRSEKCCPGISQHRNILHLQGILKPFGFKAANDKEIKISTKTLAKAKDLFDDIADLSKHEIYPYVGCNFKAFDVRKDNDCAISGNSQCIFQGFKTASNKVVKISKEALLKSVKMLQEIDSTSHFKESISIKNEENNVKFLYKNEKRREEENENNSVNLQTEAAYGKNNFQNTLKNGVNEKCAGNICEFNVEKLLHLNHNMPKCVEKAERITNFNIVPEFQGFKTANNNSVIVSKASLLKTRKIFENIDNIGNNKDVLLKTAECLILNPRISAVSNKNEFIDNRVTRNISDLPAFTASVDKQVTILEDNVVNTKYISEDVDCETNIPRNNDEDEKFKTPSDISDIEKHDISFFKGFQTASNKCVKISDEAIARSRKIFDEINYQVQSNKEEIRNLTCFTNDDINKENVDKECENDKIPLVFGSKAVGKKPVKNDPYSLKNSNLLSHIENDFKNINKYIDERKPNKVSTIDSQNNIMLQNRLDTRLLNNFHESLHTEDFYKDTTPKQCKRSCSPILSCPKAKKRKKFETPYKSDKDVVNIQNIIYKLNKKVEVEYIFSENYKKTKLYFLKDLDKIYEDELNAVMDPYIYNFDFDTLLKFEFEGSRNDLTDIIWTIDNIKTCFVESVDKRIIPEGWLDNHLKLILWKLISYEIRFPNIMRSVCSVRNVLEQLKYRYDKELYRVERPILRKMLEKDDISTKTMILAVVGVYVNGVKVHCMTDPSTNVELLVTDGWYCVKACADKMLSRLVSEGKITVGRKIATAGAELLNCEQGVSPWEDTSAVRLKIFGNSTRPARWDARLGLYTKGAILSKLSTIDPKGGKVSKMRALVLRVYPTLYVEKLEDGSTVTRSERLENLYQMKYESEREAQLEKLYEEVEKEFFDKESSESEGTETDPKKSYQSGSQLNRLMKKSNDPSQFRTHLTDSQAVLLQEYSIRNKEKIVEELQKRVQDKIKAQGLQLSRNVIPLLKIRVAGFEGVDNVNVSKAMVSIWRASDIILDVVQEGTWIDMFNVVPTAVRNSELQISAGRQSLFHRSKFKEKSKMKPYIESLLRKCFPIKDLRKIPTMQSEFNEIDTVGVVFSIEPSLNDFEQIKGHQFQNVYLTDLDKNFICINFWGGVKKFGYENIFDIGNVVACMNLQIRAGNTRKTILQYRATELTVFTETPKLDYVRKMAEELIKKLSGLDKRKFCDDCVLIKNNYAAIKHGSEFSPYRFNISDYNLNRNKVFIDSPLVQNIDVNFNLTGLDFESTFQQPDTKELSPTILKRKQIVKEKIAKLKMYGEPPPLSKIHFINKSKNAGSSYKSPLSSNVSRMNNIDNSLIMPNKLLQNSPVSSLNRTYVVGSGVNPVKLNFSAASVNDDKTETNPFEEEFEVSPPLSLE